MAMKQLIEQDLLKYYPALHCDSLTFFGCANLNYLKDLGLATRMLERAASEAELTILKNGGGFHKFKDGGEGLTAFVLLSQSHISIHTWPEVGMATVEILSYEDKPLSKARDYIERTLGAAYTARQGFGGLSFVEEHGQDSALWLRASKLIAAERTPYQSVFIFESPKFGKVLTLDGKVQLTEGDEFYYHEMLVQPAMHLHPDPKHVLIVGGGDLGCLREVLSHPVESVVLAEIDRRVVELACEHFPWASKAVADPRVQIEYCDGVEAVNHARNKYDVIIVDSTDPVPDGLATGLFSEAFYKAVGRALTTNGILVTQSGSPAYYGDLFSRIHANIGSAFSGCTTYFGPVPTYPMGQWTYTVAWKGRRHSFRQSAVSARFYSPEVVKAGEVVAAALQRAQAGSEGVPMIQ